MSKSLGVMLDLSRNAAMKPEKIKEFASILKKMGYTTLYLYMEDTYEIEGEPYFGHLRGRYSVEELQSVDEYCYSIGMEVIPCIQTLAHMERMLKWGIAYRNIVDIDNVMLVGEEKTYELIEKMFQTLRTCFRTDKINIGMDEAHNLGRGNYLTKHGYVKPFEIMKEHLDRVLALAKKYNYQATMWSDMFMRLALDGGYYLEKGAIPVKKMQEVKAYVPENVTICYWDYYHWDKKTYDKNIRAHKILSDKVSFAGGLWSWVGFGALNAESMKKTKKALLSAKENGVEEVFFTMWGDNGAECSFYSLLPALLYAAEGYRGNFDLKSIKKKFFDIFQIEWDSFMRVDLLGKKRLDDHVRHCKFGLYNDPFCGTCDFFIKDEDATDFKKFTRKLTYATKSVGGYAYLFESLKDLSAVLELKITLSNDTRKAYLERDIEKLKEITYKRYPLILRRFDKFYNSFKTRWDTENKPQGFEVQDIRLGGLKQRLLHCNEVLKSYLGGEIDKIEELETPVLEYASQWYAQIVTANGL